MTIQPQTFLKHGHCVTVFIWMNWISLESRLWDFYRAYAHLHKSPMTSIRQLEGLQAAVLNSRARRGILSSVTPQICQPTCIPAMAKMRWRCPATALWGFFHQCSWSTLRSSDGGCWLWKCNLIDWKRSWEEHLNLHRKGNTLFSGYLSFVGEIF